MFLIGFVLLSITSQSTLKGYCLNIREKLRKAREQRNGQNPLNYIS